MNPDRDRPMTGHSGRQPSACMMAAEGGGGPCSPFGADDPPAPAVARGRWALVLDCEQLRSVADSIPYELRSQCWDWEDGLGRLDPPGRWWIEEMRWEGESYRHLARHELTGEERWLTAEPPPAELMAYATRVEL